MVLLRRLLGDVLRRHRLRQERTLRDVSVAAGVSLGYLSEVERGRKEASSELLAAICGALDVSMSEVLREVSDELARDERRRRLVPVGFGPGGVLGGASPHGAAPLRVRPVAGVAPLLPSAPAPVPAATRPPGRRPTAPVGALSVRSLRPAQPVVAA